MSEIKATTILGVTNDKASQKTTILLDGTKGLLRAGGSGEDGRIELMPSKIAKPETAVIGTGAAAITSAQSTIYLNAEEADARIGGGRTFLMARLTSNRPA